MNCIQECPAMNIFAADGCKCIEEANQSNMQGDEMGQNAQRGAPGGATAGVNASGVSGYAPNDSDAAKPHTEGNRA